MLTDFEWPTSLLAVSRAGAGVKNVPLAEYSRRGIFAFHTLAANANFVKELVMACMMPAMRGMPHIWTLSAMTDAAETSVLLVEENAALPAVRSKAKRWAFWAWVRLD